MPSLNGINVKDAEFTAMQEKATALISKRSFVDNINFTSHLDIIKDQKTVKGLKEIFVKDRVQLFNYKSPFSQKIEENWFKTFYKQNERIYKTNKDELTNHLKRFLEIKKDSDEFRNKQYGNIISWFWNWCNSTSKPKETNNNTAAPWIEGSK